MEWTRAKLREEIEEQLKPILQRFDNIEKMLEKNSKKIEELNKNTKALNTYLEAQESKKCDN